MNVELLTIKCTTLKRDQFLNHFLFFIEIAQQVYVFTPKHKLWPCFIQNGHNLYFCVCLVSSLNLILPKKSFKLREHF